MVPCWVLCELWGIELRSLYSHGKCLCVPTHARASVNVCTCICVMALESKKKVFGGICIILNADLLKKHRIHLEKIMLISPRKEANIFGYSALGYFLAVANFV